MPINKLPRPPVVTSGDEWKQPFNVWVNSLFNWQREEGTWTPTFTGLTVGGVGGTVTHYGRYYKIGNMVNVMGIMVPNGTGTLSAGAFGTCYVSNLPFPADRSISPNTGVFFESPGILISTGTGNIIAPVTAVNYSDGSNDLRIYFGPFGPTTAGIRHTWSCWYQTSS